MSQKRSRPHTLYTVTCMIYTSYERDILVVGVLPFRYRLPLLTPLPSQFVLLLSLLLEQSNLLVSQNCLFQKATRPLNQS